MSNNLQVTDTDQITVVKIKQRLYYLDGMRAILALQVVFHHAFLLIYSSGVSYGPHIAVVVHWIFWAYYAVVAFIVISGFCLMRPVVLSGGLRGNAWNFYKARALRILPAYYAAMAISLLCIVLFIGAKRGTFWDYSLPVTTGGVLSHLFLLQNLGPKPFYPELGNPEINPVFWSISLEWQIYFFFPVIIYLWKRRGIGALLILSAIFTVILYNLTIHQTPWMCWSGLHIPFYFYFMLGVAGAYCAFSERLKNMSGLHWYSIAGILFIILVVVYRWSWMGQHNIIELHVEICSAFFCMAILVAGARRPFRFLEWKPLVRVGEYSYSLYLLHFPILAVVTYVLVHPLRPHISPFQQFMVLLCVGLPLSLLCSKAFSQVFENKACLTRLWTKISNTNPH